MKKLAFALLAFIIIGVCSAQTQYGRIGQFGEFKSNWAVIQIDKKLGFIDRKGNEVIKPIYDKIGMFGEVKPNLAMVIFENKEGCIDIKGNYMEKKY